MTRCIYQKVSVALKISLLSCSLPLLLSSVASSQEQNCSQAQIQANLEKFKSSDQDIHNDAVAAVTKCKAEAVKPLIAALTNTDAKIRSSAASALGYIGESAKSAVPQLIETLKLDQEPEVRGGAAYALGYIGESAKSAVPQLIESLKQDKSAGARGGAAIALGNIGESAKSAVPQLIESLKQDKSAGVRGGAASALGSIGESAKEVVPQLIESLKLDQEPEVRGGAAFALGNIGESAKPAVPQLIETLKKDVAVRGGAASALGNIGESAKPAVPQLIETLKQDQKVYSRRSAAIALGNIGRSLQTNKKQLSSSELDKLILNFEAAQTILQSEKDKKIFNTARKENIANYLEVLKNEKQSRWTEKITKQGSITLLTHALIWAILILIYPKSRQIQAMFFWNPKMRKFFGLGYVGLALTWIPFLHSKLFAPFKESLQSDADLANFNPQDYFADSEVKLKGAKEAQPVKVILPEIRGQIVLEGESGLGKSMFMRYLVQSSRRIAVYLPAKKCDKGVMEAIQAKLLGPANDPDFLQSLIYSGAIDICIDGLNEVTPDTRAKITTFVERYFKGNMIMATQPLEAIFPSTTKTYRLQPLKREQVEQFLVSRQTILPADALVSGSKYEQECKNYLAEVFNQQLSEEEKVPIRRMLSNPMELTVVAQMLASGKKPDLLNLQQQKYDIMAVDYERVHPDTKFPLKAFSETVYQMRLDDQTHIPAEEWQDELQCMERYKMVLPRQVEDGEGKSKPQWCFRHDKIQEFFIVQTFLGEGNELPVKHISDPRFRGVYFLLANLLPLAAALELRETLIQYAANTKDHTVSDTFIQVLLPRQVA